MWGGKNIAVIGGGVAGLTAARLLREHGASVQVFEKARGPGGRLSTRRRDGRQFDHGAQYFTARSQPFEAVVRRWADDEVVAQWRGQLGQWKPDGIADSDAATRWVGAPRMSALTRYLSKDLEVVTATRIVAMERGSDGWTIEEEDGSCRGPFDVVILTCPGPQAAALAPPQSAVHRRASSLQYTPCWAAMITVSEDREGLLDGYQCAHPVAAWVANDSSKPGRPVSGRWVVHAQAAWSAEHEEASPDDVADALSAAFTEVVGLPIESVQVHRWRYALAERTPGPSMVFEEAIGLALCGDALAGGKVESAWQSAVDLVTYMTGTRDE